MMTRRVILGVLVSALASSAHLSARQPTTAPTQVIRRSPTPLNKPRTRDTRQKLDFWQIWSHDIPEKMKLMSFHSDVVGSTVSFVVYLPPDYLTNKHRRYPVLYWLPNISGDCREVGSLVQEYDVAFRNREIPPMIIIGVQGVFGSYYTDSRDRGRMVETVIATEMIPRIDGMLRTIPDREHRALEGFGMGGYGAAHLAFKYPEQFGVASILSPPLPTYESFSRDAPAFVRDVWGSDPDYFNANDPFTLVQKNADAIRGRIKIRLACGAEDRNHIFVEDFHALLEQLSIPHEYKLIPGVKANIGFVLGGLGN
ncbi:MAG: alpha/beta hydrolase, partial [Tepidisphaeraceae bacterium]